MRHQAPRMADVKNWVALKVSPLFCASIGMLGDKALPLLYHCDCEIKAKDKREMKKNLLKMIFRSTELNSK